jgi:hypothetical protein
LAAELRKNICEEIKKTLCFSIIVDSTQDITKIDQVSVILRYIVVNYNEHSVQIKESSLGFYALINHSAEGHFNLILNILKKYNLDVKKCRGQGYDGASVMSGVKSEVQKRISDVVTNSLYVHCTAYNINLVIADVAKSSLKISTFFDIAHNIYLFFNQSAPTWASLEFGNDIENQIQKKILKKV